MKLFLRLVLLLSVAVSFLGLALTRPMFGSPDPRRAMPMILAETLRENVELLSRGFDPRDADHPENLAKITEHLAGEFRKHGAWVRFQDYEADHTHYRNVLAEYGPERGPIIVVGAHYDTAGDQPGADDNASGVAGLIELSRLLAQSKPKQRVILAAYVLEEPPYFRTERMGSAVHARSLHERGEQVELMISLEMIGYFSSEEGSQRFPMPLFKLFYPSRGDFILVVDRVFSMRGRALKKVMSSATDLPVHSLNAPALFPGVDFSDHLNFWNHGYPAVMVTDTAFLRNDAYHTRRDTADRLDYGRMAKVIQGVYWYLVKGD